MAKEKTGTPRWKGVIAGIGSEGDHLGEGTVMVGMHLCLPLEEHRALRQM
jgi:hypothetical protein